MCSLSKASQHPCEVEEIQNHLDAPLRKIQEAAYPSEGLSHLLHFQDLETLHNA